MDGKIKIFGVLGPIGESHQPGITKTFVESYGNLRPNKGTIHLRRQHVLGGEGCPNVPMVKRSQYIRIENSLHKHFAGMPMVGG